MLGEDVDTRMGSALKLRSPAGLTVIGIGATLGAAAAVIYVLLKFGHGTKAVSDNAALIGALIALGGVFTTQLVNSALEAQRAEQARKTQQTQRERDREIERAQRERELEVGSQRAQDAAAQAYLDQMTVLLLDKDRPLRHSEYGDEVRTLARARTLAVLSRLDGTRKRNVVQFLHDSDLIGKRSTLVELELADLSEAVLERAVLPRVNLRNATLRKADLSGAVLSEADLSGANLVGAALNWVGLARATLYETYLGSADLRRANLSGADLRRATLYQADLRGADLSGATLSGATLRKADLREADLSGADLRKVDLREADLSGADLSGAKLRGAEGFTNEELEQQAQSLKGATMPNNRKYENWLKDKEGRKEDGENSGPS
jgi:uncharacterized protein YjbI with pentapeptide repeats